MTRALALLIVALGTAAVSAQETLTFSQLDIVLDARQRLDSDWGRVDLTYQGVDHILYFNLTVDGAWQVRNIPLLSREGPGVTQLATLQFDFGVAPGQDVSTLLYGYSLTREVLDAMPPMTASAVVEDRDYIITSGFRMNRMRIAKARPLRGGEVAEDRAPLAAAHKNFPNQQCGPGECVPAALSNSLQFLKARHNLNVEDRLLSIRAMKEAVDWRPLNPPFRTFFVLPNTVDKLKNNYTKLKKIPVTTTRLNVDADGGVDMDRILDDVRRGHDVEISTQPHCVAVVDITRHKSGNFTLTVAHDSNQNDPRDGVITETLTYNAEKKDLRRGTFTGKKSDIFHVLIEAPSN